MASVTTSMRQKTYLILLSSSLILLFYSIWQMKPVIVEPDATLGLASYFTPAYWVGLALIVAVSILVFLDRELKKDAVFILVVLVLGLFLSGVAVFVMENAGEPDAYMHFPGVYDLLTTHHLDLNAPLETYNSWPAYHFLSASVLGVTGNGFSVVKYVPLFWLLFLVLVTYSTGKRFGLVPNHCFLLSFLALSSFWLGLNEYTPRLLGMILLLLLVMLLLPPQRTTGETIALIITFSALVITHGTSCVAAMFVMILLSLYRRDLRLALLFVVVFSSWCLFQSPLMASSGIHTIMTKVLNIFEVSRVENYAVASSAGRLFARYSQLSYLAIYAVLLASSLFLLLRHKITGQRRKQVISAFACAIGFGFMFFVGSGQEVTRTYIFLIVPMTCIVALSFSEHRLLIPIMCIFVALFPMARYSAVVSWGQVLTTELKGAEYFAVEVKPDDTYFSVDYSDPSLIMHYNRDLLSLPYWTPNNLAWWKGNPGLGVLDSVRYVIMSRQGNDGLIFSQTENPYAGWLQTEVGGKADLLYDNGYFQVYGNNPVAK